MGVGEKIYLSVLFALPIHVLAYYMVRQFRNWIRDNPGISKEYIEEVEEENPPDDRLNRIPGILERAFFTIVVAFDVSGAAIAMIGWATLKMATGWNRQFPRDGHAKYPIEERTKMALTSLYAGLFSLSFALVSGLIIRYVFKN